MSGRGKGNSRPGGSARRSDKGKEAEKRKRSGNNPSGLTPDFKKVPVPQENLHVKPAEPQPASDASTGEASTSETKLAASQEAAKSLQNLTLVTGDNIKGHGYDDQSLKVVSKMFTEEEEAKLLDSEDEDMDFKEGEEESIGQKALGINEDPPKDLDKNKSYADAAGKSSKTSVRGHEVLYIHSGVKERDRIEEDAFYKLWDRIDYYTTELLLNGDDVPGAGVLWKKWTDGRGLIAVSDKETSDWIVKLVGETKVKGKSFKAWHRGDYGRGRLVTAHLKGNAFKGRTGAQLMTLVMKQNKLSGKHTGVLIRDKGEERVFRFFADPTLWKDLVSRRPNQKRRDLLLKLGLGMAKFVLSKEKETHTPTQAAASEASNQQSQPVAATSNGKAGEKASEVVQEQVEKVVEDVQEPMVVATEPKESQV